jgi:predicted outer membrane lipoprotein
MRQDSGTRVSNSFEAATQSALLDHTLAAYLGDGPADLAVLQIFRRVVQALNTIHESGDSHLPLSPGAISFNDTGQPEIRAWSRPRTSTDTVAFGSAKYSAPEAFAGTTEGSSCELVDCYILGFVFYEILIGKRSFVTQFSALENGPPALWLKWHADLTAQPRPLVQLRPDLGHFAHVIDQMIEKDPAKRLGSFSDVLAVYSNFEAQTVCKTDPSGLRTPAAAPYALPVAMRAGKKLLSRAMKQANQLAHVGKGRIIFGLGVLLLAAFGILAVLMYRDDDSRHMQQPPPTATRLASRHSEPALEPAPLPPPVPTVIPHLVPLPQELISLTPDPPHRALLVPVEIRANVDQAAIVIDGQKLKRRLTNGAGKVRLPAGEHRIKLIQAGYHDSAEQQVLISDNEQRHRLQFSLSPILGKPPVGAGSVPLMDLPTSSAAESISAQALMPLARITFHVLPLGAQISCYRKDDSKVQDCLNNQSCALPAGGYDVTVRARGFKPLVSHVAISAGEDKLYEWKLEAISSALKPSDIFEDGQNWTVDANGWWSHNLPGYSFLRAGRGTFVFDILQSPGLFAMKKVSIVVNYRGEGDRVLYTIDEHRLHRNERSPGVQTDYSVAHDFPVGANYRLTVELSGKQVVVRNAAGKVLDDLSLVHSAGGKAGFTGKVKLKVVQAGYLQYPKDSEHVGQ